MTQTSTGGTGFLSELLPCWWGEVRQGSGVEVVMKDGVTLPSHPMRGEIRDTIVHKVLTESE